jgi:hypothetical protein
LTASAPKALLQALKFDHLAPVTNGLALSLRPLDCAKIMQQKQGDKPVAKMN